MKDKILRTKTVVEEIEIPEGFKICHRCKGKGLVNMYDLGWRSFAHDPVLAALKECYVCNGEGIIDDD